MSNPLQDLHMLGLNPFAVILLAESMLKSAYVRHRGTEPLAFEFPVRRGDCAGWAGVRITIEAVPDARGMEAPSGGETEGLDPKGDSPVGLPTRPNDQPAQPAQPE